MSEQTIELGQPDHGQPPETLDADGVDISLTELIVGMIDPELTGTDIDQPFVDTPSVRVDDDTAQSTRPQMISFRDGRERAETISVQTWPCRIENAEDDGLAVGLAPSPALDTTCAEEALIDLDDPEHGVLRFAVK